MINEKKLDTVCEIMVEGIKSLKSDGSISDRTANEYNAICDDLIVALRNKEGVE